MAISQKRYVDITSGVAAQPQATRREFILRCMTTSAKQPSAKVLEFTSLAEVAAQFGATSAEYAYASKYFAYTSKDITKPGKISFGCYATANIAASVIGTKPAAALDDFKTIEDGAFDIEVDGTRVSVTELDFSSATAFSDVCDKIELQIHSAGYSNATCSYANGVFVLTFPDNTTVSAVIPYSGSATATDISGLLGLTAADNPIINAKVDAETPAEAMARTAAISDNFGSFLFVPSLTTAQVTAVAEWNAATEQNYKYIYHVPVTNSTYSEITAAVKGYSGVWIQLVTSGGKEEYMGAAWLAAIDFTRPNGTSNPMYQQFGGAAIAVSTNADANTYDNAKVNYYGVTQTAGRQLAFLQRGFLADGTDAGVYANEMWMKDSFTTAFFNLLLAVNKIPANNDGAAMARGVMQETIDTALLNGTILPGKEFDAAQKAGINALVGRSTAANEVFSDGYAISITITTDPNDANVRIINYLLVYSKGDAIRKVVGTDVLV